MPQRKYKTEKAFLKKSREYIDSIKYKKPMMAGGTPVLNVRGEPIVTVEYAVPPNTADWARHLGINKQTLVQSYKAVYPDAYAEIKGELEAYAERELLIREKVDGIKFNLMNNHGWKDARHLGIDEESAKVAAVSSSTELPLEEKLKRIEALRQGIKE